MKKFMAAIVLMILVTVLTVACDDSSSQGKPIHLSKSNFAQPSITVSKGSSINLINDASALHVIHNGTWVNGAAQSATEHGSPAVNTLAIPANDSRTVGPFTVAGTFHFYCSIHKNMNLTVTVT